MKKTSDIFFRFIHDVRCKYQTLDKKKALWWLAGAGGLWFFGSLIQGAIKEGEQKQAALQDARVSMADSPVGAFRLATLSDKNGDVSWMKAVILVDRTQAVVSGGSGVGPKDFLQFSEIGLQLNDTGKIVADYSCQSTMQANPVEDFLPVDVSSSSWKINELVVMPGREAYPDEKYACRPDFKSSSLVIDRAGERNSLVFDGAGALVGGDDHLLSDSRLEVVPESQKDLEILETARELEASRKQEALTNGGAGVSSSSVPVASEDEGATVDDGSADPSTEEIVSVDGGAQEVVRAIADHVEAPVDPAPVSTPASAFENVVEPRADEAPEDEGEPDVIPPFSEEIEPYRSGEAPSPDAGAGGVHRSETRSGAVSRSWVIRYC